MSKRGYISRYLLMVKKLKQKPYSTYAELESYLAHQLEYLHTQDDTLNMGFSKRTLQRDIREIRNIFGIDIAYSKPHKGYFISEEESANMNFQRLLESFDLFNALHVAQDLTAFIDLEKRKPQGTENLYGLLHAIKNRVQIQFSYQKFWEEEPSNRVAEPYALKEFKNRWYLLAKDERDNIIKSFALDRLTNLQVANIKYHYPNNFKIEQNFRYCFGIINPNDDEPQDIILSFNPIQGQYIKTLPLLETQQIIVDNDKELQIGLRLYITYDFIMELLSFGDKMKVLKPESLAVIIKTEHENAFKLYEPLNNS